MKARIKEDDESVPYRDNGYYYITRYEKGGQYPIYSRKKGDLQAEEEIMFNVNELAKNNSFPNTRNASHCFNTEQSRIHILISNTLTLTLDSAKEGSACLFLLP